MDKKCTKCGKLKESARFHKDSGKTDKLKSECKLCTKLRTKEYYQTNRKKVITYSSKYYKTNKKTCLVTSGENRKKKYQIIANVKEKPCMDCGQRFPPCVMDLDHVRGKKLFALGQIGTRSEKSIVDEIAKCDVVCANCHRVRTWTRYRDHTLPADGLEKSAW